MIPSMLSNTENMITLMPNLIKRDVQQLFENQTEHKKKIMAVYREMIRKNRILVHRRDMKE